MRSITILAVTLLIGLAATVSIVTKDDVIITEQFLLDELSIYTSEHDIVEIIVPVNALNYDEDNISLFNNGTFIFFVEADMGDNGELVSKGLYVMKDNVPTKLLENGRSAAAARDKTNIVYLAATDGLYIYNATTNKAEKYGTITDNIVGIAKENGTDALYILTAAHEVYKVTDNGNKKNKLNIENAIQIVLGHHNNIYFSTTNKEAYVYSNGRINKIRGLPKTLTYVKLLRPSFMQENSVNVIVNDQSYVLYPTGRSERTPMNFRAKPSAYSLETVLTHIYAYKKKIYKYNLPLVLQEKQLYTPKRYRTPDTYI